MNQIGLTWVFIESESQIEFFVCGNQRLGLESRFMDRDSVWEIKLIEGEDSSINLLFALFSVGTLLALPQSCSLVRDEDIEWE